MEAKEANTKGPSCPGCVERDRRIAALEAEVETLKRQVDRLTEMLERSQRSGKRQAAPFRKGPPKAEPRKPGRRGGADYGTKAFRAAPAADRIDEDHDADSQVAMQALAGNFAQGDEAPPPETPNGAGEGTLGATGETKTETEAQNEAEHCLMDLLGSEAERAGFEPAMRELTPMPV